MAGDARDDVRVVAIAVDESQHSDFAVDFYLKSLRMANDKVVIIHCQEYFNLDSARLNYASGAAFETMLRNEEQKVETVKTKHKKKMEDAGMGPGSVVARSEWGHPGKVICDVAKEENCSLIVIGTRGMGKIRRTLLGSVSDFVVHHAPCPVVVCRHPSHH